MYPFSARTSQFVGPLWAALVLSLALPSNAHANTAVNGIMIVDCNIIDSYDSIPLEGFWGFEWLPEETTPAWQYVDQSSSHKEVPGTWGWEPTPTATSHFGHAAYRIELRFTGKCPSEMAVQFPIVGSTFEAFVLRQDGQFESIGGRGRFTTTAEDVVHQHLPFEGRWRQHDTLPIQLLVKIAKYKGTPGGIWRVPHIARPEVAQTRTQRSAQQQFFVLGILVFITFYHLILYLRRRDESSSLYFALISMLMSLRIFFVAGFLDHWIPTAGEWLYEFRVRLDWVTYAILVMIVYRYIDYLFPNTLSQRWYQHLVPLCWLCVAIALLFDLGIALPVLRTLHVLFAISFCLVVVGLMRATRAKIVGVKTIILGIIIFIGTALIDILAGLGVLSAPALAPAGLILFVFFNSHVISNRHAIALQTAEKLSRDLQYEVEVQTMELRNRTWEAEHAKETAILAQAELAELNQNITENVLKRYLPPKLIDEILEGRQQVDEQPQFMDITVLFADLAGFTSLSEKLGTQTISRMLNQYLTAMADVVFENQGTIDKFIGDSIMVLFGAPLESQPRQQVDHAISCARAMRTKLNELNQQWASEGLPILSMRVGIHRGPALVGNLGSDRRSDYTAIGTTVNVASRIEGVCTPGYVFMSEPVAALVADEEKNSMGPHKLKGISTTMTLYCLTRSNVIALPNSESKDTA